MRFSGSLSEIDKEKAGYELIGVPLDDNALIKGASGGAKAIRSASQRLETFLWSRKCELSDLLYYDRGDMMLELYSTGKSEQIVEFTFEFEKRRMIFIGGDHSISYPIVKYLFEHNDVTNVIVIDAHADFRDSYENNQFSNACVMRRIAELIGFENVTEVGIRTSSEEEYTEIKDHLRVYDAVTLRVKGINWLLEDMGNGEGKTYLSIDIDVLDPSFAPGVEHPEPCGLSLAELLTVIRGIMNCNNVVASDLVEVNPRLDHVNGLTSLNAARIIFELLACYGEHDNCY